METEKPTGCDTCPHATARFNGGNGATTCELLSERIVTYGHHKPTERPECCPWDSGHSCKMCGQPMPKPEDALDDVLCDRCYCEEHDQPC